jgi:hypothetical protein
MEGVDRLNIKNEYDAEAAEQMNLFRNALLALIPILQQTEAKWDVLENYDDFYSISESLFKLIVINFFEAEAEAKNVESNEFSNYAFYHKTYKHLNHIRVTSPDYPNTLLAFNFMTSREKPFDTMYCNRLDGNGALLDRDLVVDFETASFSFKFR